MKLHFLAGKCPMCKTITPSGIEPYPTISQLTSHEETLSTIEEFYEQVKIHGAQGHCLLKGLVKRPLINESRAGSTTREEPTNWLCLDLDSVDGPPKATTVADYLSVLFEGQDPDYILQWSNSMGIKPGIRCHVFVLLDIPMHPEEIKRWLYYQNLGTSTGKTPFMARCNTYSGRATLLNNSGAYLKFGLDVSVAENSRLLYIADPNFTPGTHAPPFFKKAKRIELVKQSTRAFRPTPPVPTLADLKERARLRVAELRKIEGLPPIPKKAPKVLGTVEYQPGASAATSFEFKEERDFVYFNINGGDSWAYFHPTGRPDIIYNFKREPNYLTADVLPTYWNNTQSDLGKRGFTDARATYLAIRDFATGQYYNGIYSQESGVLERFAKAKSETQLRHFLGNHGFKLKLIPDWDVVWDPHSEFVVHETKQVLNTFKRTGCISRRTVEKVDHVPTHIEFLLRHVVGNDLPTYLRLINWLAYIVQNLRMTGTAWVLHGVQGTGKGVMYHRVLVPLFGAEHVTEKPMEQLEERFTGFLDRKFIVVVDEIEQGNSLYHNKIIAKLKNIITEPTISVRRMYSEHSDNPNYLNMMFFSNSPMPVYVEPHDRRFNVGVYQAESLLTAVKAEYQMTTFKFAEEVIPAEVEEFYKYLMHVEVNEENAKTPLINEAKSIMILGNRTSFDRFCDALNHGDLEFFWEAVCSVRERPIGFKNLEYTQYRDLVISFVESDETKISREQLHILASQCIDIKIPAGAHKFSRMLALHGINITPVYLGGRTVRGMDVVKWQVPSEQRKSWILEISKGLV